MSNLSEEQKTKIFDIVNSNKSASISLLCTTLQIDSDTLIAYAESIGFVIFNNKIFLPEEMDRLKAKSSKDSLSEEYSTIVTPSYPIVFSVSASVIFKRSFTMMLFGLLSCTFSQIVLFIILYLFGLWWIYIIIGSLIFIGYFVWFFNQILCKMEIYQNHFVYRKGLRKTTVFFDAVLAVARSKREIVFDRGSRYIFREIKISEHSIVLEYDTSHGQSRIDLRPFSFNVGMKIHSIINDQIRLYYKNLIKKNQK